MFPTCQPQTCPPRLENITGLSNDAQIVMAALYREYEHRKQQFQRHQVKIESDTEEYYQSIFKDRLRGDDHLSACEQSVTHSQTLGCNTDRLSHYQAYRSHQTQCDPVSDRQLNTASHKQFIPNNCKDVERHQKNPSSALSCRSMSVPYTNSKHCISDQHFTACHSQQSDDIISSRPLTQTRTHLDNKLDNSRSTTGQNNHRVDLQAPYIQQDLAMPDSPDMDLSDSEFNSSANQEGLNNITANEISKYFTETNVVGKVDIQKVVKRNHKCTEFQTNKINPNEVFESISTNKKTEPICSINKKVSEHKSLRDAVEKAEQPHTENLSIAGRMQSSQTQSVPINQSVCVSQTKKRKSKEFFAPFKKLKTFIDSSTTQKKVLPNDGVAGRNFQVQSGINGLDDIPSAYNLNTEEKEKLEKQVCSCEEIILTLVYKDGSSQLTDLGSSDTKKKPYSPRYQAVDDVTAVAVLICQREMSACVMIPTCTTGCQHEDTEWVRQFIESIFQSVGRKICFGAKDIVVVVMNCFNFDHKTVCANWTVLDLRVAAWLLDADNPPASFSSVLSTVGLIPKNLSQESRTAELITAMKMVGVAMQRLYQKLQSRDLWGLFFYVETRLIPLLAVMEQRSMKINIERFVEYSNILKKKIEKLEQKAFSIAGHSFVINSHPQLRQVLFEELKLDTKLPQKVRLAKTNVGHQTSTSEAVLSQLMELHPLPAVILEHRQKLKSTYVDGISSCVNDGRLSTHWDQTAAATGRLTSYQPNIQAVPKTPVTISGYTDNFIAGRECNDEMNIFAREPFVSSDGFSFIAADFQQIELRLLCHLAEDPVLLNMFKDQGNKDIFVELTSQWLRKSANEVTNTEREQTKRVVYSVMYGAGKGKLAEYLKISRDNAKAIMTSFLECVLEILSQIETAKFPVVNLFTRQCVEFCQKNGFTKTIFKRRRMIPNIKSRHPPLRAQAERQAVNFCVQGSAADLCKAAMLQVEDALNKRPDIHARLLVQIHDELLLEVEDKDIAQVQDLLRRVMESEGSLCGNMVELKIPIRISLCVGKSWAHMSPV